MTVARVMPFLQIALFCKLPFLGCPFACCLFALCLFVCCLFALCLFAWCLFAFWLFAWCLFALCLFDCWFFAWCLFVCCLFALCLFEWCLFVCWLFVWCLFACCLVAWCLFLRDTYMIVAFFSISSFYRGLFFYQLWLGIYQTFHYFVIDIPSYYITLITRHRTNNVSVRSDMQCVECTNWPFSSTIYMVTLILSRSKTPFNWPPRIPNPAQFQIFRITWLKSCDPLEGVLSVFAQPREVESS